mmetsp:Transcript_32248/g.75158  ORF Transcript_32248/g.75158 Transcript_32248/m.75158 type:complete len:349 (-) Transcript_32248:757-1803(-)
MATLLQLVLTFFALFFLRNALALPPLVCAFAGIVMLWAIVGKGGGTEVVAPVYDEGNASGLQWGASALQGRRPYMEDIWQVAHAAEPILRASGVAERVGLTHFFAVYDGHGGKRAATWTQKNLLPTVLSTLSAKVQHGERGGEEALDEACRDGFLAADSQFVRYAAQNAIPDGTTAVCCMLQRSRWRADPPRLLVANVGDSRCAMVRRDGSAFPLSRDHKPNRPDEKARVEAAGGHVIFAGCWRVQGDLAVSRAFGDLHLKRYGVTAEPELSSFTLDERDAYLVLASDGLWDVVDEQQCATAVLSARDSKHAARVLCELAMERGSMDNVTALVIDVRGSADATASATS